MSVTFAVATSRGQAPEIWSGYGPAGAVVNAIAVDPLNSGTVYAGTQYGGIFKSVDGGATWASSSTGLTDRRIQALAVDSLDPNTLYAGLVNESGGPGLFKSTDGGATWNASSTGLRDGGNFAGITSIVVDPFDSSTLYAGSFVQVFKSTNSGGAWSEIKRFTSGTSGRVAIDPQSPSTLYASGPGYPFESLFKSTDAGATWAGLPGMPSTGVTAIVVDPRDSATIFIAGFGSAGAGVWKSSDGGSTWNGPAPGLPGSALALAIDPLDHNVLYAGAGYGYGSWGIWKSANGGESFAHSFNGFGDHFSVAAIAIDPLSPGVVYASGWSGPPLLGQPSAGPAVGVYKTTDGGSLWRSSSSGITNSFATKVRLHASRPQTIIATLADQYSSNRGISRSLDGGATWSSANAGLSSDGVPHNAYDVAIDPSNPDHMYAAVSGGAAGPLFRSFDAGQTWSNFLIFGLPSDGISAGLQLEIDPQNAQVVYLRIGNSFSPGLYRSIDGGYNWSITGLPSQPETFAVDPRVQGAVYATSAGSFYSSTDGGTSWELRGSACPSGASAIGSAPGAPAIFVACRGNGVLRSTDEGVTWTSMNDGLTNLWVEALVVGPGSPETLYVSAHRNTYATSAVFRSTDGGASWSVLGAGLPPLFVRGLALSPSGLLYAATDGNGVFSVAQNATYSLSVTRTGTGSGSVTSSPAGIDCGVTCSASFPSGSVVALAPVASAGSNFEGWSGDVDCGDGSVTLNSNLNCTASFSVVGVSSIQRVALIALYNSTNGPSWTNRTNWLGAPGTECSWFGVTCDATGTTVTKVLLPTNNLVGTIPREIADLTSLTDLNFYFNQLSGGIPSGIGNLTSLTYLNLYLNRLSGGIPPSIGNLRNLSRLELNNNQLSGGIPVEMGTLTNLRYLDLHSNLLTGGVPAAFGNLASLFYLDLSGNPLGGTIPAEIGNLTGLFYCGLNSIQLTGSIPSQMGNMTSLRTLYLSSNQLTGLIPPQLGNLSNLTNLYLHENGLTGGIPSELGGLANLDTLFLNDNGLTGGLPSGLLANTGLRLLYVYNNSLSGPIPTAVGGLTNIERLWIHGNAFVGSLPTTLMNLTRLNYADFRWNALYTNDPTLRSFLATRGTEWESTQTVAPTGVSGTFTGPGSLRVDWTPIAFTSGGGGYRVLHGDVAGGPYTLDGTTAAKTDSTFAISGLAPATYFLVLQTVTNPHASNKNVVVSEGSPEVSATVLPTIPLSERNALIALYNATNGGGWTNRTNWLGEPGTECTWFGVTCNAAKTSVVRLTLVSNNLTGPLPPEIGHLPNLVAIIFQFNHVSGPLPAEIGSLASLQTLSLVGNQIQGPLPDEIGNLSQLVILDLFINQVTGSIPASIGGMPALRELTLALNQLSGPIPPQIGSATALTHLMLAGNRLTGTIPQELGNLAGLRNLNLFNNQLVGPIPPELGSLSSLQQLNLGLNQLDGAIPPSLANLSQLVVLRLDQNRLSGSIPPQAGNLTRLTDLYLNSNQLAGAIPPELGALSQLRRLFLNGNKLAGMVPGGIGSLSLLEVGQLDLRWNSLQTNDGALKSFLDGRQIGGNWEGTQTIPPAGVSAASAGAGSILVSWTPIAYTADSGGYQVSYATVSGGPYTLGGTTPTKSGSSLTLTGLTPGQYFLVVQSVTNPHSNNQSLLVSDPGAEVPASTQITPTINWADPADIVYGTALGAVQLDATADTSGTFSYDPPAGTVLLAGPGQTLSVTFTPDDPLAYAVVSKSVAINVLKATPVITWVNPTDIVYGTALGDVQLNATANVPGSFVYSPPAGTVLNAAPEQALIVEFTPADGTNYEPVQKVVRIRVAPAPLTIRANDESKVYGEPLPAFSATPVGFVNGDGLGSLSGELTLATPATAASPVGAYEIVPGGVSSNNYVISFVNGVLAVNPASTSTALISSADPAGFGDPVTISVTVTAVAPGSGSPMGTVHFWEGSTLVGSAVLSDGIGTLTTSLGPGTHSITAQYPGDSNFLGSTASISQTVNSPSASTSTTLTLSPSPSSVTQSVTMTAVVAPLSGNAAVTGQVAFYDGAVLLESKTIGFSKGKYQTSLVATLAVAGFHSLTAVYSGDANLGGSTSSPIAHTVYSGPAPDTSKTTITSAPTFLVVNQPFSVNALVEATRGGRRPIPTGSARLLIDGRVVATVALDAAGAASLSSGGLAAGIHALAVQYTGDGTYAASTSSTSYALVQSP